MKGGPPRHGPCYECLLRSLLQQQKAMTQSSLLKREIRNKNSIFTNIIMPTYILSPPVFLTCAFLFLPESHTMVIDTVLQKGTFTKFLYNVSHWEECSVTCMEEPRFSRIEEFGCSNMWKMFHHTFDVKKTEITKRQNAIQETHDAASPTHFYQLY